MKRLDFARLIRSGASLLPKDELTKGHLIWHAVDELSAEPYDPSRNIYYIQQFQAASNELDRIEAERLRVIEEAKAKARQKLEQDVFNVAKRCLAWKTPFDDKLLELDSEFSWTVGGPKTKLSYGTGHTDGAVRMVPYNPNESCPVFDQKIKLRDGLKPSISQIAYGIEQGTLKLNEVYVSQELLRLQPKSTLTCNQGDCQNFRASVGCASVDLTLTLK